MDYENLTPQYRIEEYLEAIVEGWAEATQYPYPDYPSWRLEEFLDAFITYIWEDGDHPRHPCPEPAWRLEECLRAIYDVMTGAATPWPFPLPTTNRIEEYLAAIHAYLADGTELPVPEPVWRIEQWLAYVLDAVKQGGGVETTVSGSPAHITNALAKAALSVLASIEPIQDLHGYSNPWPAGGGKNLLSQDMFVSGNRYINSGNGNLIDPVTDNPVWKATDFINIRSLAGETLTLNHRPYGNVPGIGFYDESKTFISGVANSWASVGSSWTFSVPNGAYYIRLSTMQEYLPEIQLERGATATSYAPYSNICPITGRTGLSVYRTGKNLLDASNCVDNIYPDGGAMKFSRAGGASVFYASVKPNTTYTLSANNGDRTIICSCDTTPASGVAIKRIIFSSSSLLIPQTFTTAADETLVALYVNRYASTKPTEIQLELGSTATTYEPYTGNTYAVGWTSEAGTVYGGTHEVVGGALTDEWAEIPSYNGETITEPWLSSMDAYTPGATPTTGAQVVYKLATPLTYQLTAQEVQMLLGENYVWASSGDTVSVTYYAEGNANPLQSLNILLGGNYSNPKTADDVSDREALEIILGGNK